MPNNDPVNQMTTIEVIADFVCPWCYLGIHRLRQAVEIAGEIRRFQVNFKPFELDPLAPAEGRNHLEHLSRKFGGRSAVDSVHDQLTALGKAEGLPIRFDLVEKSPNTFQAHRLAWFSSRYGLQQDLVWGLLQAYFSGGRDIGDRKELIRIGAETGMPVPEVEEFLSGSGGKKEVREMEQEAHDRGIPGVPAFILQGKWLVRGAQPVKKFLEIFEQVAPGPGSGMEREWEKDPQNKNGYA